MVARPRRLDLVLTVVLILCWAGTFPSVRVGVRHCPPVLFAGLRCMVGGLVILLMAMRRGVRAGVRAHWVTYALVLLTNVFGLVGLQTLALRLIPAGMTAVVIYLQPVLVALLARLTLGEPLPRAKAVGLAVAFAGVVVVSWSALAGGSAAPGLLPGLLLALGAGATWALGTIVFKRAAGVVDTRWAVALPFLAGGVVMTVTGLLGEGPRISPVPGFWLGLGFSGVLGTGVAWLLWFHLVAHGEAGRTASRIFFVPIGAVALGVLLLGERLTWSLGAGAVLVILGVWLVNRERRPDPQPSMKA